MAGSETERHTAMRLNQQDFDAAMAFVLITFICAAVLMCVLLGCWSLEGFRARLGSVTIRQPVVDESYGKSNPLPDIDWTEADYRKQYADLGVRFEDSSHWYMVYGPGANNERGR